MKMTDAKKWPMAEANRLSAMLRTVLQGDRFPVDVKQLALEYSRTCFPEAPIAQVEGQDIPGFEGMLIEHKNKTKWMVVYNDQLPPGRVRFTLAHEFGHYVMHRKRQTLFECSERDMHDWDSQERVIESEADTFASFLLMPLDDYRQQVDGAPISIELLRHCSARYGVSVMAAALKWLEIAPARAVVVAARDGFLLWARSNKAAFRSGAYLATRKRTIEVPEGSSVARGIPLLNSQPVKQKARLWFPNEPEDMSLTELVHVSEGAFPYTLGLLLMTEAPPRFDVADEEDCLLDPLYEKLQIRN